MNELYSITETRVEKIRLLLRKKKMARRNGVGSKSIRVVKEIHVPTGAECFHVLHAGIEAWSATSKAFLLEKLKEELSEMIDGSYVPKEPYLQVNTACDYCGNKDERHVVNLCVEVSGEDEDWERNVCGRCLYLYSGPKKRD